MKTQKVAKRYNDLRFDSIRNHVFARTEDNYIWDVRTDSYQPSDERQLRDDIRGAIRRYWDHADSEELLSAAKEGREAELVKRELISGAWWNITESKAGLLAIEMAQSTIQNLVSASKERRDREYETYRQAVIQGVALVPEESLPE